MLSFIGALASPLNTILERVLPDKEARDKAKLELLELEQAGKLQEVQVQMQAIIMEAKHEHWWTSGARPSLMWAFSAVFASIPLIAVVGVFIPGFVPSVATGMAMLLNSFPDWFSGLVTTCFLGYVGGRSLEKGVKEFKKNK
jgi:hypothetical protein